MMRRVAPRSLHALVREIFEAAGSEADEAESLAEHLVTANLVGHDSHGIVRVSKYIQWAARGDVVPNRHARPVTDRGAAMLVDGDFGYGQVIAKEAMDLLANRTRQHGFALVALRNAAHIGRVGAWPEQLAAAGLISVHFVNTSGFGILVAPHGGSDRRMSANPIAAGAPRSDGPPIVLDMATSIIAEGKIQMMRNKGEPLPEGMVLDGHGIPTRDPAAFYADLPGAILPFGAHKGYGLSVFCELLAGSLSGGSASNPSNPTAGRLVNNMLSFAVDPDLFGSGVDFAGDTARFVEWITGSPPSQPGGEVLIPGEIEAKTRERRERDGIPVDDTTWNQLESSARKLGVASSGCEMK